MRWNPFARKASAPETKSFTTSGTFEELVTGAVPTMAGIYVSAADALRVPAVANAVQIIAEAAATLDIYVKRREGGVEHNDEDHALLPILRDRVNDWTSSFEFFRQLVLDALTMDRGGMAMVIRANDGRPVELIRYMPGILTCDTDQATGQRTYRMNSRVINAGDVIHLLPPLGRSPLSLAREAIGVAVALERHAAKLFTRGARPGGALLFPQGMPETGVKNTRDAWAAAHGSGEDSGKTVILTDGADFKPFTFTSTDAQFLENRKFQINEIARAFNIPAPMIGDLERATWSNSEQKGREFLSYCLEPWLRGLEGALSRALLKDEERGEYVIRFDRDDLTRADLSTLATVINSLIASQTINPNEGRAWLGQPPRPGGDEFKNPNISTEPKSGASDDAPKSGAVQPPAADKPQEADNEPQ